MSPPPATPPPRRLLARAARGVADRLRDVADDAPDAPRSPQPAPRTALTPRYPHLRVATCGDATWLDPLVATVPLEAAGRPAELRHGIDLVHVGPGGSLLEPAHLDAAIELEQRGVATVLHVDGPSDLRREDAGVVRFLAARDAGLRPELEATVGSERAIALPITVDTRRWNPAGWVPRTPGHVLVVGDDEEDGGSLVSQLAAAGHDARPVRLVAGGDPAERHATARAAAAVVVAPGVRPTVHLVADLLALVAAGSPVLVPRDGVAGWPPALRPVDGSALPTALSALLADEHALEAASLAGRRQVLRDHGDERRLEALLAGAGVPIRRPRSVSVLLVSRRPELVRNLAANALRQRHPELEFVLVVDEPDPTALDLLGDRSVQQVIAPRGVTPADRLNLAVERAGGEVVARFDEDVVYGPNHVTDLLLALEHSGADVVGKPERFTYDSRSDRTDRRTDVYGEGERDKLAGAALAMPRDLALRFGFLRSASGTDRGLSARVSAAGGRLYATHPYELLRTRSDGRPAGDDTVSRAGLVLDEVLPDGDGGVPVPALSPPTSRDHA